MNVTAFSGSPRKEGNSHLLLEAFLAPFRETGGNPTLIRSEEAEVLDCRGCLRCNLLKRCTLRGDRWGEISRAVLEADVLVFATPIYFHHATASLKRILDRFRSFMQVQITREGLIHTPWEPWSKQFVLLTAMGSPSAEEARPLEELFRFICGSLGPENRLSVLHGTRLAVPGQIAFTPEQLAALYARLSLPEDLAGPDSLKNRRLLEEAEALGRGLCG